MKEPFDTFWNALTEGQQWEILFLFDEGETVSALILFDKYHLQTTGVRIMNNIKNYSLTIAGLNKILQ